MPFSRLRLLLLFLGLNRFREQRSNEEYDEQSVKLLQRNYHLANKVNNDNYGEMEMKVERVIFDSDKVKELINDNKKLKTQLRSSNYKSYLKSETATDGDT